MDRSGQIRHIAQVSNLDVMIGITLSSTSLLEKCSGIFIHF